MHFINPPATGKLSPLVSAPIWFIPIWKIFPDLIWRVCNYESQRQIRFGLIKARTDLGGGIN